MREEMHRPSSQGNDSGGAGEEGQERWQAGRQLLSTGIDTRCAVI